MIRTTTYSSYPVNLPRKPMHMQPIGTLGIQTPIIYINNPIYDKTNNIYSLALAKDVTYKKEKMDKELCIRCNKPTPYDIRTPITLRRYYVEGSGQLCPLCYQELYGVAPSLQSIYERDLGKQPDSIDSCSTDYSK